MDFDCSSSRSIEAIGLAHFLSQRYLSLTPKPQSAGSRSSKRIPLTRCGPRGRAPTANTPRRLRRNSVMSLQRQTAAAAVATAKAKKEEASARPKRPSRREQQRLLQLLRRPPLREVYLAGSEERRDRDQQQQQQPLRPSTLAPPPPLPLRLPRLSLAPLLLLRLLARASSAPLPRGPSTLAVEAPPLRPQQASASAGPAGQQRRQQRRQTTRKKKQTRKKRQRPSSTAAPRSSSRRRPSSTPRAPTRSGWIAAPGSLLCGPPRTAAEEAKEEMQVQEREAEGALTSSLRPIRVEFC